MRRRALAAVAECARADAALWLRPGQLGGQGGWVEHESVGAAAELQGPRARELVPWVEPWRLPRSQEGRFARDPRARSAPMGATRVGRAAAGGTPAGLDWVRLFLTEGPHYLACVVALRTSAQPPFSARDLSRLHALVPALRVELQRAAALEAQHAPEAPLALVVGLRGELLFTCGEARRWLGGGERRAQVAETSSIARRRATSHTQPLVRRAWVTEASAAARADPAGQMVRSGLEARWTRLAGARRGALLLQVAAWRPPEWHREEELTTAQEEVARLIADGHSVVDVARALQRSSETVRTHLRQVYQRLGVSSRAELARALFAPASRRTSAA